MVFGMVREASIGDKIVKPLAGLSAPPEVSFLWLHN